MKNSISYYYNLNPENIHQNKNIIKFSLNNYNYVLYPYEKNKDEINDILNISIELYYRGLPIHQIIPNVNNEFVTNIDNKLYVLLLVLINNFNIKITYNDIIYFLNNSYVIDSKDKLERTNWPELWSNKIDYFEYQMSQIGNQFPIINESFGYFIGMAENSITFLKNNQNEDILYPLNITHKRITVDSKLFDLCNPLNLIIDSRVRDVCEYFKSQFFNNDEYIILEKSINYIESNNLSQYECLLFFVRMLFPSFYFDLYEHVIFDDVSETKILNIISKINKYESFLGELNLYLKRKYNIETIDWLTKVNY